MVHPLGHDRVVCFRSRSGPVPRHELVGDSPKQEQFPGILIELVIDDMPVQFSMEARKYPSKETIIWKITLRILASMLGDVES